MLNIVTDLTQQKAVTILRILYPIWAVVGIFSIMYVPATLIVAEDAAATASIILANESLFSMGIAGSLITQLILIVVVLVLYKLFKPVNKNHASLMVIFALVGVPIAMLNTLNRIAALLLLSGADYLKVFGADQLQALMMFFLNLNEQGVIITSIFWGLWLFPLGYLIYKSGYFPKIFGILMVMAVFGYLIGFFMHILLPNYEAIAPVLDLMTVGEIVFMGWVVLKGAKIPERNPEIT
ncbi:MAG: protein of unknown function (DUF4386) [Candidatus Methanocomedens sp.]|nr:MAG: protein of unknown function (DUF4386) [ANME-2 cluster archaeon]